MLAWSRTSRARGSALRPRASISSWNGFKRFRVAAGENEIGPGPGQGAGEILAQAAAGAGDNGDFSGQIKKRIVQSGFVMVVKTTLKGPVPCA